MTKSIYDERYKLLCTLLIQHRKEARLSQYELAERLQKPQSFIAKVEGGERRMDVIEFLDIARALNIDPFSILKALETLYSSKQD